MKKLFFLFFLISCATLKPSVDTNDVKLNFEKDLSFQEFNEMLIKYAKSSPYPDIDK